MLYAHTPNEAGEWHGLADHLHAVADRSTEHARAFGGEDLARVAGLLHDAGKASDDFQRYLQRCAANPTERFKSVDHKTAGAQRAMRTFELLVPLILGHHGGLPNVPDAKIAVKEFALRRAELDATLAQFDTLGLPAPGDVTLPEWLGEAPFVDELFFRLVFSALIDADRADTERHFQPGLAAERGTAPAITSLWDGFAARHAAATRAAADTPVNAVRREVFEACLQAAREPPGWFRLTVPTGGGKTLSGLAFALRHARLRELRRVVVAVPYLTITEQTVDVYRRMLDHPRALLEHTSSAGQRPPGFTTKEEQPAADDGGQSMLEVWRRLAAQDWDAPIVVTTTVQLFESLLGNATGACRKLHRIPGSVIVLDEAQTIPPTLRGPITSVLDTLVRRFGCSVVLCTATQPELDLLPASTPITEIAPDPPRLFATLKRVAYEWPHPDETWSWERTVEEMRTRRQALAVVNTVADAHALAAAVGDDALHLSTSLCPEHRRAVLAEVRRRLEDDSPCLLVSTQVVEAGVDLDFPLVLRALGPLDRIVQAAGRCNREGRHTSGRVVVFRPTDGHLPPGPYLTATGVTEYLLALGVSDMDDPATFRRFFQHWQEAVTETGQNIQDARADLAYETVGTLFRMIPDDSIDVVIPYGGPPWIDAAERQSMTEHVSRLVARVRDAPIRRTFDRDLLRALRPFCVAVRARKLDAYREHGLIGELPGGLYAWTGTYHPVIGLVETRIAPEQLYA